MRREWRCQITISQPGIEGAAALGHQAGTQNVDWRVQYCELFGGRFNYEKPVNRPRIGPTSFRRVGSRSDARVVDGLRRCRVTCNSMAPGRFGFQVRELIGGLDWWKSDSYATHGEEAREATGVKCAC